MKMFNISKLILMAILFFGVSTVAIGQKKSDDQKQEKVIIIKETVGKDGKTRVETITKENGEIEVTVTVDGDEVDSDNIDIQEIEIIELKDGDNQFFLKNGDNQFFFKDGDKNFTFDKDFDFKFNDDSGQLGIMLTTTKDGDNDTESPVVIDGIIEESAAEEAGLQKGDIITKIDGQAVTTIDATIKAIKKHKAGEAVEVTYTRDGQENSMSITLKKRKDKAFFWKNDDGNSFNIEEKVEHWSQKGEDWIAKIAEDNNKGYLGVGLNHEEGVTGASVDNVSKDGAAEKAGLQKGDVITAIDGKKINTVNDLLDIMKDKKIDDEISIDYIRDGKSIQVKATLQQSKSRMFKMHRSKDGKDIDIEWNKDGDVHKWIHKHKSDDMKIRIKKIIGSDKGFLGVYLGSDKVENGIKLGDVVEGGAAEKAGLQADDIITKINETTINDYDDLKTVLNDTKPNDEINVTYIRAGETQTVPVVLTEVITPEETSMNIKSLEKCDVKGAIKKIVIIKKTGKEEVEVAEEETDAFEQSNPNQLELQSLDLFPNPNNGAFTVNFETESKAATTIQVVGITGNEVFRDEIQDFSGRYSKKIDISSNAKGVYFLNIIQGEKKLTKKLIYQ